MVFETKIALRGSGARADTMPPCDEGQVVAVAVHFWHFVVCVCVCVCVCVRARARALPKMRLSLDDSQPTDCLMLH